VRILVVVFMVDDEARRSSKSSQSIVGLDIRLERNASDYYPCWPWIIVCERLPSSIFSMELNHDHEAI